MTAPSDNAHSQQQGAQAGEVLFVAHLELLHCFLRQRAVIVEKIGQLLNAQSRPLDYQQDHLLLARYFKDCFFFALPTLTPAQIRLRDGLELAHWHSGFKPRATPGNDIIDPAALTLRAFHMWRQTRWPGQKGRMRYAHTLFNVYLLRCLALLIMRLWDQREADVPERLAQAQALLEALWQGSPSDQPRLIRDVRWLFPVAMSPTTDELGGYFDIAGKISATFSAADQVETHKAWIQTGGGHLRSQLRHLSVQKNVAPDEHSLVLLTRLSNALDIALLLQGLVTLMRAYHSAIDSGDTVARLALASAICQGISVDPELFLSGVDLLGPYSVIEHLFVTTDVAGNTIHTRAGQRHLQLLQQYKVLLPRIARALADDCQRQQPAETAYSPYGALYGFSSNLLELMAFKTLQLEAGIRFSMEDVFSDGGEDKLAWVNGWRDMPHVSKEISRQFEYPRQFAIDMHARLQQELLNYFAEAAESRPKEMGRLLIASGNEEMDAKSLEVRLLPARYVHSSDAALVAAGIAVLKDEEDLLCCRREGEFLVSYRTSGGWAGISKDVLTEVLGAGNSATLTQVPQEAAAILRLLYPDFVELAHGR